MKHSYGTIVFLKWFFLNSIQRFCWNTKLAQQQDKVFCVEGHELCTDYFQQKSTPILKKINEYEYLNIIKRKTSALLITNYLKHNNNNEVPAENLKLVYRNSYLYLHSMKTRFPLTIEDLKDTRTPIFQHFYRKK